MEAAARNFNRWDILNQWVWPNWYYGTPTDPHTFEMEVDWTMIWLTGYDLTGNQTAPGDYSNRLAWADTHLNVNRPPIFNQDGGPVSSGFAVEMTKHAGELGDIYYTLDGSDPRVGQSNTTVLVGEDDNLSAIVPDTEITNWTTPEFDDTTWPTGQGGVGFEMNPGDQINYTSFINLDVSSMHNVNATCYVRIPFTLTAAELADTASLILHIRYDDAFVAYLNGTEVARSSFAPTALTYNAAATDYREDAVCVNLEAYDLTAHISLLNADDDNVLAIHGLNSSTGSSDFLISTQLIASNLIGDISVSAYDYSIAGPPVLTENTQIKARILSGNTWSALNQAAFLVGTQPLYINELMADNDATIEDPDEPGAYDDWFEIFNPSIVDVDLGGMYLTDDLSDPTQWQIPAGVIVPAGGFILFWADDDLAQGNTHTNFKLSKDGEEIGLFDTDVNGNVLVDSITFGPQTTDVSFGRVADGAASWTTFEVPTPNESNDPQ